MDQKTITSKDDQLTTEQEDFIIFTMASISEKEGTSSSLWNSTWSEDEAASIESAETSLIELLPSCSVRSLPIEAGVSFSYIQKAASSVNSRTI